MIDIIELEKSWIWYKIKSYLPHFTIFMSLSVIAFLGLVFFDTLTSDTSIQTAPIIRKEPVFLKKNITPMPLAHKKMTQEMQLKLQPSLHFLKKMQDSKYTYHQEIKKISHPQIAVKKAPKIAKVEQHSNIRRTSIHIKREDTSQDLQSIIKRFKASNDPHLSLFLAKKYYEQKNYQQSYNYALITNKIDSKIDESWIVFCKSLVHLGKKKLAIKVLQDYTQTSKSSTANILLSNIKSGKFR